MFARLLSAELCSAEGYHPGRHNRIDDIRRMTSANADAAMRCVSHLLSTALVAA